MRAACCMCLTSTPAEMCSKKVTGSPSKMAKRLGRDADIDLVGGVEQQVAPQKPEQGFEGQRRRRARREHVKGGKALVDEHLVDDELEEDRQGEAERIEQDRGDSDVGEQSPLAKQFRQEPAQPESRPDIRPACRA